MENDRERWTIGGMRGGLGFGSFGAGERVREEA